MSPETKQLNVASHPRNLAEIRKLMKKVSLSIGFAKSDVDSIILAVDEACSNIIRHSYKNDPDGRIDISIDILDKKMKIKIVDFGTPCDTKRLKSRPIDDVRPGGLGIYIMNQVMDEVEYDFSAKDRNVVSMSKSCK